MAKSNLVRLPLHLVTPQPNIPAGLNPLVVLAVAHTLRNGNGITRPIKVRRVGDRWVILDGRHRWMAHWMAGCTHITAKVKR